jgi:hypothetical protein
LTLTISTFVEFVDDSKLKFYYGSFEFHKPKKINTMIMQKEYYLILKKKKKNFYCRILDLNQNTEKGKVWILNYQNLCSYIAQGLKRKVQKGSK